MDVKSTFLNGNLIEEVYLEQLLGYITYGKEQFVCHLKKVLYTLKWAPRAWYFIKGINVLLDSLSSLLLQL